jgi:hypothetical protein
MRAPRLRIVLPQVAVLALVGLCSGAEDCTYFLSNVHPTTPHINDDHLISSSREWFEENIVENISVNAATPDQEVIFAVTYTNLTCETIVAEPEAVVTRWDSYSTGWEVSAGASIEASLGGFVAELTAAAQASVQWNGSATRSQAVEFHIASQANVPRCAASRYTVRATRRSSAGSAFYVQVRAACRKSTNSGGPADEWYVYSDCNGVSVSGSSTGYSPASFQAIWDDLGDDQACLDTCDDDDDPPDPPDGDDGGSSGDGSNGDGGGGGDICLEDIVNFEDLFGSGDLVTEVVLPGTGPGFEGLECDDSDNLHFTSGSAGAVIISVTSEIEP